MRRVDSHQNPLVKHIVSLHKKKGRATHGQILVEGTHPVEEALASGLKPVELVAREDADWPASLPEATVQVPQSVMAKLSTTASPPPVLAVLEAPAQADLCALLAGEPLFVVAHQLQDPGNIGTLTRSALAFGARALVLCDESADPFQPKVIRASAGLIFRLPVIRTDTLERPLRQLAEADIALYATRGQPPGSPYKKADFTRACAIILGSEGPGLPQLPKDLAVQWLSIPMASGVESLNVAVSGSVLLAEAAAQRGAL